MSQAAVQSGLTEQHLTTVPRLMNQRELADYLGKSEAWCENARWQGKGPKYIKVGGAVRYRITDVEAYLEANERSPKPKPADS